ncbi:MAG TPA: hypothetical protein VFF49_01485 [Thermodesulfobacteriota bacterium]|nr:hypothetical protein [Thermodesulfobacteriota bacterium]
MNLLELKWSTKEKKVAREAFTKAYKQEMRQIQKEVYEIVKGFREENDVWRLHDYLYGKRKEIDEKYDYRYSVLIYVFARLMSEGYIKEVDLEGLSQDKLLKIKGLLKI